MCFLECSASLGSPCFPFAIAKVGRFGILAKRCDLFFSKICNFVSGTLYIYCARDGKWGQSRLRILRKCHGACAAGRRGECGGALGRMWRGVGKSAAGRWGECGGVMKGGGRRGEVNGGEMCGIWRGAVRWPMQCGAMGDAVRCDGRCSVLR